MAKLMDIKGCWNKKYSKDYNMWEGQILLQDDGWFEGIVIDLNDKEDRFIFGIYHPKKVIELFALAPSGMCYPLDFYGEINTKSYDGPFGIIGTFTTTAYGSSHIITQYTKKVNEGIDEEKQNLEARIQKCKNRINTTDTKIYEEIITNRKTMVEVILRNYERKRTNQEEFKAINDSVKKSTKEKVKKMPETIRSGIGSCVSETFHDKK